MALKLVQNQNLENHPSKKRGGGGNLLNVYLLGLLVLIVFGVKPDWVEAQTPISGVINSYEQITGITLPNTITVSSTTPFTVGDLVLIIQMQDATVDITNTVTFGSVQSYNSAGLLEFNTISSISGFNITLTTSLANTYNPAAGLQIVRVPEYIGMGAVITGSVFGIPWNGIIGGVIALKASTLDFGNGGVISATGSGFRGGVVSGNYLLAAPSPPYGVANTGGLGEKGESITLDPINNNLTSGSAPSANGGGAGGTVDCGGGGGANGGAGGTGNINPQNSQGNGVNGGGGGGGANVGGAGGDGSLSSTSVYYYGTLFGAGGGGGSGTAAAGLGAESRRQRVAGELLRCTGST
jgi:hypothetical protein